MEKLVSQFNTSPQLSTTEPPAYFPSLPVG